MQAGVFWARCGREGRKMEKLSHLQAFLKSDWEGTFLFSGLWGNFPWQHISQRTLSDRATGTATYLVTHLGKQIVLCTVEVHYRAISSSGKSKNRGKRSLKPFLWVVTLTLKCILHWCFLSENIHCHSTGISKPMDRFSGAYNENNSQTEKKKIISLCRSWR